MKIAINGAGIAGPTLAYWLQRQGHEITLIERAPDFRTGGYVIDFWGHGYTIAERMGLLPEIHEAGYQIQEVRFVDSRGRRAGGFPAEVFQRLTAGRFTSLPRGDLAEIIDRQVADRVETLFDNTITAINQDESKVWVELEKGDGREFDLVFGADGLHSQVRKLIFGPREQFEIPLGYHVAAAEISGYQPRDELAYVCYNQAGKMAARFALRENRTLILLVFVDRLMSNPVPVCDAARKQILSEIFVDAGWECRDFIDSLQDANNLYFDRVAQIHMPMWTQRRVALLGDAAACASLLAGEGTGLAMTEAYVLATELACANNDHSAAFRRYEQQLRPFLERKQTAARNFASSFAPKTTFGVWCRNQISRLLTIPVVAEYVIGRDLRDEFELPGHLQ